MVFSDFVEHSLQTIIEHYSHINVHVYEFDYYKIINVE